MSQPYLAEIRVFGFNFAPLGWAFCSGEILPISQNTAVFSLVGTTYGGNGTSNFALPNLQDNVAVGFGQGPGLQNWSLGETLGETTHTLLVNEMAPAYAYGDRRRRRRVRGPDGRAGVEQLSGA